MTNKWKLQFVTFFCLCACWIWNYHYSKPRNIHVSLSQLDNNISAGSCTCSGILEKLKCFPVFTHGCLYLGILPLHVTMILPWSLGLKLVLSEAFVYIKKLLMMPDITSKCWISQCRREGLEQVSRFHSNAPFGYLLRKQEKLLIWKKQGKTFQWTYTSQRPNVCTSLCS